MKTTLNELRTIIKDIIKEELEEEDFDIPLPVLKVKSYDEKNIPKNFTGIAKYSDGTKEWFKNGKLHREDGPAIEWADGMKEWYKDGLKHREDGPAVILYEVFHL